MHVGARSTVMSCEAPVHSGTRKSFNKKSSDRLSAEPIALLTIRLSFMDLQRDGPSITGGVVDQAGWRAQVSRTFPDMAVTEADVGVR